MNPYDTTPESRFQPIPIGTVDAISAFLRRAYGWMFAGLTLTGAVAVGVAGNASAVQTLVRNPMLFFGLMIAELGLVVFLSARILKMSAAAATASFLVYSALNGVTLSFIFLAYTATSIATTFFVTAGMFGALALIGTTTKRNLSGLGSFAMMGLVGVILASIAGMFLHSSGLQFGISVVGVIVFTLLTAYDAQKLKAMAVAGGGAGNLAILGALALYLDFVNLFLFMLRFLGSRRN